RSLVTPLVMRTAALAAVAISVLVAAPGRDYSKLDKAYYADAAAVEFIRPGLVIAINSAKIAADGTITAVYTLTDPKGAPLDSTGITTPGVVSVSLVVSVLPKNSTQYTAYTTRVATGTVVASTIQAGADTGGKTTSLGSGQYQYIFATKAPTGFDST